MSRVVAQADNFADLKPDEDGDSYGKISMENLTVFYSGGNEVGRAYFFMEGGKKPDFITEPPVGKYRRGGKVLQYLGDGAWLEENLFKSGETARTIRFKNHQMNGPAEGVYENGKPTFEANYKDGRLDGELVIYDEDGEVKKRELYKEGERVEE